MLHQNFVSDGNSYVRFSSGAEHNKIEGNSNTFIYFLPEANHNQVKGDQAYEIKFEGISSNNIVYRWLD